MPEAIFIGGPNGAGKTSAFRGIAHSSDLEYLETTDTSRVGAARKLLAEISQLRTRGQSFVVESTLSSSRWVDQIRSLQESGYICRLLYLGLASEELAVARLRLSDESKGRSLIDEKIVRRRYQESLRVLFGGLLPTVDEWSIYDNSDLDGPTLIASGSRTDVGGGDALTRLIGQVRSRVPIEPAGSPLRGLSIRSEPGRLIEQLIDQPSGIQSISPRQFEMLVAELLARDGYSVQLTPVGADHGIDVIARRVEAAGSFMIVVQCKRLTTRNVSEPVVRDLFGVMNITGASSGLLATTTGFSRPARSTAELIGSRLALRDLTDIRKWIGH